MGGDRGGRRPNALLSNARVARGLTQQELAEAVGAAHWRLFDREAAIDANHVSKLERGVIARPNRRYRDAFRSALGVSADTDLGFSRPGLATECRSSTEPVPDQRSRFPAAPPTAGADAELEIDIARRALHDGGPTEGIQTLELLIEDVVERYELTGPGALGSSVRQLREFGRTLHSALRPGDRDQCRLHAARGRVSGLLAYMAVNAGRYSLARAYSREAAGLANAPADDDLSLWIAATEAFALYYHGRYAESLRCAQNAIARCGPTSSQRRRILVNGIARAAGRLGEQELAEQAIDRALLSVGCPQRFEDLTIGSCISFAPYTAARTTANAATAYLSLGQADRALALTTQLTDSPALTNSVWSQSLVGLDHAAAMAQSRDGDPRLAAELGTKALIISTQQPIDSIFHRANEFGRLLSRMRDPAAVKTYRDALHSWQVRQVGRT